VKPLPVDLSIACGIADAIIFPAEPAKAPATRLVPAYFKSVRRFILVIFCILKN
jgi:hypothetical protein